MPETIDPPTEAPPDAPPPDWASVEGLPEYAALPPDQKATVVNRYADTLHSHVVGLGADPEQVGKEIDAFRQQKMSSIYPTQAQPALLDTSAPGSGSLATQERRKIVTGENAPPAANELTGLAASERAKIAGNTIIDNPQASTAGEGGAAPVRADGFDPSKQDAVSASVANVFHQGTTSLGDIVKGMAGLAVQYPGLPDTATAEDKMKWLNSSPDPLLQWARQTPQTAEDLFPVNPKYASNPVVQAIGSAGQLAPIVASGPFAPFVMAMQTAGQHIDNDYKSLLDSGLSPEQAAQKTFRNATAAGLTDEVVWSVLPAPLRAAGDKFLIDKFGADGVKKFLLGRVAQAGEGAVLGATSRISQNAAAGDHLLEGVGSSAAGLSLLQLLTPRSAPRGAHGETATHAPEDVRDHLANVSTQSLELASSDPEFRKTAPYDPALVDAELAKRHLSAAPDEAVQIAAGDTALREAAPDMHAAVLTELEKRNLSPADAEKVTAVREADRQAAAAKDAGLDETARALQEKADAARGEAVPAVNASVVNAERPAATITDAFSQMGKGVTDNFYAAAFDALQKGSGKISGVRDPILAKAKPFFESGKIKTAADLRELSQSGALDKPLSEVTPVKATERPATAEAAQADLEKPVEQMSPEEREKFVYESHTLSPDEFAASFRKQDLGHMLPAYHFKKASDIADSKADILRDKPAWNAAYERAIRDLAEPTIERHHQAGFGIQISKRKPVSAAAVEQYGINLPDGYTREGDLYVFKPKAVTPAEAVAGTSLEAKALAETTLSNNTVARAPQTRGPVKSKTLTQLIADGEPIDGKRVYTQASEATRTRMRDKGYKLNQETEQWEIPPKEVTQNGNSKEGKGSDSREKAGQQGLLSEAGAGSIPARQGTIKLDDRGTSPTSDGTLFDEHLNETLARGWRKMGDFYESTAGNGGKHAPEEIAKALDLVANKDREGRTSIGIPYHMMARAIETLKSKGLWEADSSGSSNAEIKRSTTPSDSVRSQNPEAASPPVPPVSEGAAPSRLKSADDIPGAGKSKPSVYQSTLKSKVTGKPMTAVNLAKILPSPPTEFGYDSVLKAWKEGKDGSTGYISWDDAAAKAPGYDAGNIAGLVKGVFSRDPEAVSFSINRMGDGTYFKIKKPELFKTEPLPEHWTDMQKRAGAEQAAERSAAAKPTDLAHTVSTDLGKALAVPKGATALRVTDAEGRVTVVKAADLKGANVLRGAGPYKKIEAGTVATAPSKRGEFVPLKEKVGVKDSPLIRLEQAADAARARLKEKLARTSSGVDPTIVSDLAIIAAHHLAKGGRDFAEWTKQTVAEWGEAVRPHLQAAWDKATGSAVKGAENPSVSAVKDLGVSEEPQGSSETASHSAEVSHPSALKEGPLAHEQATAQAVADALREKGAAPVAADTIAKRYAAAAKVLNQRDADFGAREHVYDLLRDDLLANIEKTGSPFKTKTADGRVVDYSASMRASTKLADYLARGEQQNVRGEAAGTVAENAVAERGTNEARSSQAASHVADAIDSGIADITSHPDFVADNPGVSRKDATQAARIVLDRITAQTFGESYGFSKGQPGRPSAAITKLVADPHFEKSVRENVLGRAFAAARDHEDDVFGFGPGAAAKGEIPEAKTVSIRNARVDEERAARGELPLMQPARKAMGTTWDQAMQRIERNPSLGSGMVDDILNRKKTDISEVDHAVLLHEKIEVMNNRSMEAERIADPHTSEEDRVEARVRWAALEDRINQIDQATHEAGTISGRALQFRRALAADDYTFSGMERKLRAVKGEALTPEESAGVKAQADRIADADKQATEREQAAGEKQAGAATDAAIKQMRGDKAPVDRNDVLAKMKARIADGDSPKDLGSYLQRIALSFVRAGITEREPLIQAVHDFTSDVTGFDPRQTRDAVSGYGDFKPLDKETAKVQLRQIKGEAQQISKLEDMSAGHAPKKTGIERREPSDEERVLIKEVNEAKKAGGFDVTDPEKQLKSALDAVKTRLGNQIKDLSRQIDTGERDVKTRRPVPTDAEADALRTQRDELKKQFDSIFGTERSEAQRLAAAKSYLTRRAADLEDRIARNDFAPRPKPAPVALDAEGLALRAKTEQLKLAFDRKLKQYELDNRKWWEKGLAQVAGTARAAALSGYDTLFKLLGYTIGKGIELPLNEAAKAGLEKIPGYAQIAAKANLEAGPHVKSVARYYREFATEGMKEAGRVLRTYGDSNLKSVYGKKNVSPPQWYDFFGVLHQAEKAPTLTAATALHLEKATAAAIASGADITDPMVQGALRKEAFDYAQRSILQEDNLAANLINGAMSRMRAKDPKTGESNAIRSAVASTVETLFTKGIIKTPANYVMQTLERTPVGLATGGVKAINAWRKGVDTLTNTEANTIHRLLSVGLVGSAMFVWGAIDATKDEKDRMFGGYYQPGEKRGDADTKWGTLRLQGHTISHLLTHFPVIESAQIGSTMMRVALSKLHKKDEQTRGIAPGLISAVFGLIDRAPIASQAFRFTKVGDPMKQETAVGEILRGLIPQIVQNIAGDLDKRNGEPVHRAPTTIMQSIEMGIPGLRQRVPEKKAKSVKASDFWGS